MCLLVRAANAAAIGMYAAIGMEHVLDYRSRLFFAWPAPSSGAPARWRC